ncbi:mandelate racemase [Stappia sp. F7233]|uniref:Mandelate racemase n=1 Tax=Stappia albiluteola TaxID=2758565 RepID=A0A839ADR8_9HYPH|nr:enolase C-terminal domain-like protein [Stappia albiluteola]MBA5777691.1 mandelate racemase [Stappia albiluteola]
MSAFAEPALTITGLRARAVKAPLARPIKTASGEIPQAPLVLIDIETSGGVTGSSYLFAYTPLTLKALVAFLDDLAPHLVGEPVAPVAVMEKMERLFRLLGKQGLVGMAMSGVDMALWDALAKSKNSLLVTLLGGIPRSVPAYDSYGVVDPRRDAPSIERSLEQGFKAIKIKLGIGSVALDVETVRAVREMIGPDVRLMVDYNQSLNVTDALERINAIAGYDIAWIEEPVPAEDLAGHAAVRERSPVPIQTGENWWFAEGMANSVNAGASDLVMPDLMKMGGVTGWLKAMGIAQVASLPVSTHLFIETSAHVQIVTPNPHYLEYLDFAGSILTEPLPVTDGCVVPRGPGIGIAWDEKAVARNLI